MTNRFVLYGGGDCAVEVATYLGDIYGSDWSVGDIVAPIPPRMDALTTLIGTEPVWHRDLKAVPDLGEKRVIIAVGDPMVRHRILLEVRSASVTLTTLVHPTAYIARTAIIGEGAIICPFAWIGPFARVGANCILNVRALVAHDVILGESAVLSPGADINGHARAGKAAYLGAGSVVHPKVELGRFSKLSAGSVLTQSVGAGFLMHGNPAKGRQMMRVDHLPQ